MITDGTTRDAGPEPVAGLPGDDPTAGLAGPGNDLVTLLAAVPSPLIVLDASLRIVLANDAAARLARGADGAALAGLRPGEAFGCVQARRGPEACMQTPQCPGCGMFAALSAARDQGTAGGEWSLTLELEELQDTRVFEVRVRRLPAIWPGPLWMASLADVGEERRKESLQRLFFHDVLNVAGGIRGLSQLIPEMQGTEREECLGLLDRLAMQLTDMIGDHRDLLWAERGDLRASPEPVDLRGWLDDLAGLYGHHPVAEQRLIAVEGPPAGVVAVLDARILSRVAGNLLKNALEASAPGETVTVSVRLEDSRCALRVHNPGVMPPEVRRQLFQRAFSTKERGRGLGTYSARLLTEHCLGGRIAVQSQPGEGTIFTVTVPIEG